MATLKTRARTAEKRIRRRVRAALSRLLRWSSRPRVDSRERLDAASIRSVLVVRMNARMGNTLFLTPLLTAINEVLPHAAIDVLSRYPDAPDVLRGLPGLRNVITLPKLGWRDLPTASRTLQACRANQYDLAIDPAPNSAGGRIALALCRSRWRLGFGGAEQWLRLDCAAELPAGVGHEALQPLLLLKEAFGYRIEPGAARLRVANSTDELVAGARLVAERKALAHRAAAPEWPTIGFFASARGKKDLGPAWWREFWDAYLELMPHTTPLEVLPTPDFAPVNAAFASVHCRSPRMLAATLAHVDRFFSADTGPMHLASAAGVPTVAFFDDTNPAAFGPIKPDDTVLQIGGKSPRDVAAACAAIVAAPTVNARTG
jgi:ADP-heptose:LPS heptosyltransferase